MTEEEDDWIALGGESDEDNAGAGFEEYGEQDQNPATASDSAGLEPLAEDISNAGASIASLRDASLAYPGTDRGRNADNSSDSSDSDSDGAPRRKRGRLERERTDQQQEAPEEEAQGKELKPDEKKPDDKLPTSTDAGSAGKGPGKEGSGTGTSKQGGAASGRQAAVAANATPATAGRGSKRPHRGGPAFGPTPAGRGPGGPPFHARAAPPQAMGPQQGRWRPNFIGGSPQRGPIRPPVPGIDMPMGLGMDRAPRGMGGPMQGGRGGPEFFRGRAPGDGAPPFREAPLWGPRGPDGGRGLPLQIHPPQHMQAPLLAPPHLYPNKLSTRGRHVDPGRGPMNRRPPGNGPPGMMGPVRPPAFVQHLPGTLPRWDDGPAGHGPRPGMFSQPPRRPFSGGTDLYQRGGIGPVAGRR
eukprot:jgi/Mesvir1/18411/Mv14284-RA.1